MAPIKLQPSSLVLFELPLHCVEVYMGGLGYISWLMMPWILSVPGYQHTHCWLYIQRDLFIETRKVSLKQHTNCPMFFWWHSLYKWCLFYHRDCLLLTHWGRHKMDAISQTTFSNSFSWMEMYEFCFRFHWNLFLRFELTIFQHWFR